MRYVVTGNWFTNWFAPVYFPKRLVDKDIARRFKLNRCGAYPSLGSLARYSWCQTMPSAQSKQCQCSCTQAGPARRARKSGVRGGGQAAQVWCTCRQLCCTAGLYS